MGDCSAVAGVGHTTARVFEGVEADWLQSDGVGGGWTGTVQGVGYTSPGFLGGVERRLVTVAVGWGYYHLPGSFEGVVDCPAVAGVGLHRT